MLSFKAVCNFLAENNLTKEQMDHIWVYMYGKNWKVKKLADMGMDWSDLNETATKSLIEQFRNNGQEAELNATGTI